MSCVDHISGAFVFDVQQGCFVQQDFYIKDGLFCDIHDVEGETNTIDCSGRWIIPGLVNVHEHQTYKRLYGPLFGKGGSFEGASEAALTLRAVRSSIYALRCGVTTICEVGAPGEVSFAMREGVEKGLIPGPRMKICGWAISITGGHGFELCEEVDSTEEMRKAVRVLLKKNVDSIKLLSSHEPVFLKEEEPVVAEMSEEMVRAAVEEAHKLQKKVHIHAMGHVQLTRSINAGVDVIHHGAFLDTELAKTMNEKNITLVPTLSSYRLTAHERFSRGEKWSNAHRVLWPAFDEMFEAALQEHVNLAVGTDSLGDYVDELEMMNRRGLSKEDCLRAATIGGAKALGMEDEIGSINIGKCADYLVLKENPLDDLQNIRHIECVIKDGKRYDPDYLHFQNMNPNSFIESFDAGEEMM